MSSRRKILIYANLTMASLFWPLSSAGQETDDDFLEGEKELEEEGDFPDLVRKDETGGVMDELALLEDSFLDEEVESASKLRQSILWSPSVINTYTREDVLSSGAATLSDFLRRVPGFDVLLLKPSYPLLGARALTEETNNLVLVLTDGREELVELNGMTLINALTTDIAEVERIEVIRGPGSALYGANAFAAVVNITTVADRPPPGGEVHLNAGEEGHRNLYARIRGAWDVGDGELSFNAGLGTPGVLSPSDREYRILDLPYRTQGYVRYREDNRLDLSLHAGTLLGRGLFYTTVADLDLDDGYQYWVMGKAQIALGESSRLKCQVYYNRYVGDFFSRIGLRAYDIWIADLPPFPMDTPTVDGQVQVDLPLTGDLLLVAGGNLRYTVLHAANYIPSFLDELRGAGFVQATFSPLEVLQLTGGLRLDLSSEVGPALSPRAALVFRPWTDQSFRLSYGLAFRKPSLYESQVHLKITEFNPATPEIVDILKEQFGNEDLTNEKVHSVEAGWMGIFLDERLRVTFDLFFNVYQDTITFVVEMPLRLGFPDMVNSTVEFRNVGTEIYALGAESELAWRPAKDLRLWGNLGWREAIEDGQRRAAEPRFKVNLGAGYMPASGPLFDVALHFVSGYEMPLKDPVNLLNTPRPVGLGNDLLLIGRAGYRIQTGNQQTMEVGLLARLPLTGSFREYPGAPSPDFLTTRNNADFGGEYLVRLISLYLRGSF